MIAIVDYQAGNLTSVKLALDHVGAKSCITAEPSVVRSAERVVFPGVGAAGAAMARLRTSGLGDAIRAAVAAGTPVLGVCLGMQLLFEHSEEDGGTDGLGILAGRVQRFHSSDRRVKIPHMGWNAVRQTAAHPLFAGVEDGAEFYFVHSFYCAPADPQVAAARTGYAGVDFACSAARGNLFATQFHPERSGRIGLRMYENFLHWDGAC
jgi:imidazole glycerol-phosphate synthase subunit HisH